MIAVAPIPVSSLSALYVRFWVTAVSGLAVPVADRIETVAGLRGRGGRSDNRAGTQAAQRAGIVAGEPVGRVVTVALRLRGILELVFVLLVALVVVGIGEPGDGVAP